MKSRVSALLALAFGFAGFIVIPAASEGSPALAALKGPSGIALVELFEHPPRLSNGDELRTIAVPSADVMAAKFIGGEYAAAVLPINMAAKLRASGIPLVLGAIIGNGMLSLLTSDPKLATLADLRGAELAVAGQGATPEFLIRRLFKDAGLDPDKDLRLAFALSYPDMATAVAAGRIGQALLPEPFATLARMANPSLRTPIDIGALWKKSTGMTDYPMTALVFRSDSKLTKADRTLILEAARASIAAVLRDPEAAGLLVEKNDLGLKAKIAAASIPRCNFVFESPDEARAPIEALLGEFLKVAPASIGGRLPDEAFYQGY
jgi:NitT/TauT family transport system substrate-binding protein